MPAWIAGTQVRTDASGDIHVNLDSSTPCWNDAIEGPLLKVTEVPPHIFAGGHLNRVVTSEPSDTRARSAMLRKRPCSTTPTIFRMDAARASGSWISPHGQSRIRFPSSVMNSEPEFSRLIVGRIPISTSFLATRGDAVEITSTGSGNFPSRVTTLLESAIMMNLLEACRLFRARGRLLRL